MTKITISPLAYNLLVEAVSQVGGDIDGLTRARPDGQFEVDIKHETYLRILRNKETSESISDYIERALNNFTYLPH